MQQEFHQHLKANFSFLQQHKILLAISGGIDSVVLAHLCKKEGLAVSFAHCNFQLRGKDSHCDEQFVRELADQLGVKVYVKSFDTRDIAAKNGQSIQIAARELRYTWFDQLCLRENYAYLLTAHHLNDNIETFLINVLRGTGLQGLTGIPPVNNTIVRPLLKFTRAAITSYARENNINWREDYTNATDDYLRNRLRHHIVPALEKENPKFTSNFLLTQRHLKDAVDLITDYGVQLQTTMGQKKNGEHFYAIEKIKAHPHPKAVLYELFKSFGFSAWDDIYALLEAQPGKQIISQNYRLLRDRKYLIVSPRKTPEKAEIYIHKEEHRINFPNGQLFCEKVTKVTEPRPEIGYLAADKIVFPLKLRVWKPGDAFQPFGMKGHKKMSDFLKDEKLSLFEKENTWVLLSEDTIIWVVGHRISEDYRIRENTTNILKIEFLK